MIKVAVIEDDKATSKLLIKLLCDIDGIDLVGNAFNGQSAVDLICHKKPELVFFDIELPDKNSFEVLEDLSNKGVNFSCVFISSHKHYAIKAIKVSALDYILKPFTKDDLKFAIKKYHDNKNLMVKKFTSAPPTNQDEYANQAPHFVLTSSKKYKFLRPEAIIYCSSKNYSTQVYFTSGESMLITKTLKEFENILGAYGFLRIHNSHLINSVHIKSINRSSKGSASVVLSGEVELPVSRRRKEILLDYLKQSKIPL